MYVNLGFSVKYKGYRCYKCYRSYILPADISVAGGIILIAPITLIILYSFSSSGRLTKSIISISRLWAIALGNTERKRIISMIASSFVR